MSNSVNDIGNTRDIKYIRRNRYMGMMNSVQDT